MRSPRSKSYTRCQRKKIEATKAEVQHLLDARFIREVRYPQWLANVVMVHKKNENGECAKTLPISTSVVLRMTSLSPESTK
jgi:hypothetical protein